MMEDEKGKSTLEQHDEWMRQRKERLQEGVDESAVAQTGKEDPQASASPGTPVAAPVPGPGAPVAAPGQPVAPGQSNCR